MFIFFFISLFLCKFCFSRETTTVKKKLKSTAKFLFEEQAENVMEKKKKEEEEIEEQVTRGHNIVADGWAGASNPHPHPNPHPTHTNIHKKYLKRLFFHFSTR